MADADAGPSEATGPLRATSPSDVTNRDNCGRAARSRAYATAKRAQARAEREAEQARAVAAAARRERRARPAALVEPAGGIRDHPALRLVLACLAERAPQVKPGEAEAMVGAYVLRLRMLNVRSGEAGQIVREALPRRLAADLVDKAIRGAVLSAYAVRG